MEQQLLKTGASSVWHLALYNVQDKRKIPMHLSKTIRRIALEDTVNEGVTGAFELERADGAVGNGIIRGHTQLPHFQQSASPILNTCLVTSLTLYNTNAESYTQLPAPALK
jgi:hypothetical protein